MKRLLIPFLLAAGFCVVPSYAQDNTICQFTFRFTNATGFGNQPLTAPFALDNRSKGCNYFTVNYQATGLSAVSLTLQSAGGPNTAGTFGTYSGSVTTGVNPLTSTTGSQSTFTGYVGWLRINATGTASAATWAISGIVYGSQTAASSGTVVVAPSTTSIAQADTQSNTEIVPSATGVQVFTPNLPYQFNGATFDREFVCPLSAKFNLAAGTDVVLAAGVASTNIKICHLDFSSDTSATMTIRQGTGTTCLTNTLAISGDYPAITSFAMDYQPTAPLKTSVQARDVCLHTSAAATVGGTIFYAQF